MRPATPPVSSEDASRDPLVVLGQINGLFGVRGWVKVFSHTEPRENIVGYRDWLLAGPGGWQPVRVLEGKRHGKGVIARLAGCEDRDAAQALVGREIAVRRSQLPPPGAGCWYWTDLEGMEVVTEQGESLGRLDHLFATGANDVMVVKGDRQRLIPFVTGQVVKDVDADARRIRVDWDPEF